MKIFMTNSKVMDKVLSCWLDNELSEDMFICDNIIVWLILMHFESMINLKTA